MTGLAEFGPAMMVVPAIDQDRLDRWAAGCRWFLADTLLVDNTPDSHLLVDRRHRCMVQRHPGGSVSAAWNAAAGRVIAQRRDWLVICSSSVQFGPAGGLDLYEALRSGEHAGRAAVDTQLGWHLIAIARWALLEVGLFDEGFTPAYFEDTDWLYRAGLAGVPSPRENAGRFGFVEVDATCETGESIRLGLASPDMTAQETRYLRKWGGPQGAERYRQPWNGLLPEDRQ